MHITTRFLAHIGRKFNSNPFKSGQNNGNDIISKNVIWNNGGLLCDNLYFAYTIHL
jgi:hypothetical protein